MKALACAVAVLYGLSFVVFCAMYAAGWLTPSRDHKEPL